MDRVRLSAIALSTFALGILLGLGYAAYLHNKDQAFILSLLESHLVDIPHDVAFRLKTIEAAQNRNESWIIGSSCSKVRASVPFFRPDLFPVDRQHEIVDLMQRARRTVQTLEQAHLCPQSMRPNNSFKPKPLRGSA
jgi:hypothetical protein